MTWTWTWNRKATAYQWVCERFRVLLRLLVDVLAAENDLYGTLGAHHCDFGVGPAENVDFTTEKIEQDVLEVGER